MGNGSGKTKVTTIQVGSKEDRPFSDDEPAEAEPSPLRTVARPASQADQASAAQPAVLSTPAVKETIRTLSATLESWNAAQVSDTAMPLGLRLAAALVSDVDDDEAEAMLPSTVPLQPRGDDVAVSTVLASPADVSCPGPPAAGVGFLPDSPKSASLPGQVDAAEDPGASSMGAAAEPAEPEVAHEIPPVVTCAAPMRGDRDSLADRRDDWLKSLGVAVTRPQAHGQTSPARGKKSPAGVAEGLDIKVSLRDRSDCMKDEARKVFDRYKQARGEDARNFGGGVATIGIGPGGPLPAPLKV
eukprot:TRINITY_DN30578_c0_g3_i3.p1 TRINITY_DN30578_c0_g3~~TRINITY_DN30578_c0_g3_i3.p1  ORF type:complete len:300 (+),score=60.61 TRINITY_DN30578_c0_g3_i3:118-1017(+)